MKAAAGITHSRRASPLVGIYRYYFHKGDATDGNIRERYHDFAHPPKIEQD